MPDEVTVRSEFYRVEVQRPAGGGWETVHVYAHAYGAGPEQAAWSVLRHHWPVNIHDRGELGTFTTRRRAALAQADGYRMRLIPASHNRTGPREPVAFTFVEVELAEVRRLAARRRQARAVRAAAYKAYEDAKRAEWMVDFDLKSAKVEAALLKASDAEIARAVRGTSRGAAS